MRLHRGCHAGSLPDRREHSGNPVPLTLALLYACALHHPVGPLRAGWSGAGSHHMRVSAAASPRYTLMRGGADPRTASHQRCAHKTTRHHGSSWEKGCGPEDRQPPSVRSQDHSPPRLELGEGVRTRGPPATIGALTRPLATTARAGRRGADPRTASHQQCAHETTRHFYGSSREKGWLATDRNR